MGAADLGSTFAKSVVAGALQAIATDLASGSTTVAVGRPYPRKVVALSRWVATMQMFVIVGVAMTAFATVHSDGLSCFADWRMWPEGCCFVATVAAILNSDQKPATWLLR